jgi:hypothetical protein
MALINTTTTGILGSTFSADGTGPLNVQQNGVTLGIYGNIPVFSAFITSTTTVSATTWTKINFDSKDFDTNNNYDTTNYRYTPTVAGYYSVIVSLNPYQSGKPVRTILRLYKNGIVHKALVDYNWNEASSYSNGFQGSALVYMNGTTDYIEGYFYGSVSSGTQQFVGGTAYSQFSAHLVKAA